jgi:hypothetical protein
MDKSLTLEIPTSEAAHFEALLDLGLAELRSVNETCRKLHQQTQKELAEATRLLIQTRTRLEDYVAETR